MDRGPGRNASQGKTWHAARGSAARVASAAMIDAILDELRECIELLADAERQSTRRGERDVHLTPDGAHRVVAALVAAGDAIEGAG